MKITSKPFGKTNSQENVTLYTVTNIHGNYVNFLDYGAIIQSLIIHDKNGKAIDVVLGYDSADGYEKGTDYFGAFIGRVANRLELSRFALNGKTYTLAVNDRGKNHLHGGVKGFDKYLYHTEILENGLRFSRISPDMEEGYPGNLKVSVTYTFNDDNVLSIRYMAETDKSTPVNLTNHAYFNLNGHGNGLIENHRLKINASYFTENNSEGFPNGNISSVTDTAFDFRAPKTIGRDIRQKDIQLTDAGGYDHNYIPDGTGFRKIAEAEGDLSGITMDVWSDMPGVQFYAGNFIKNQTGKSGASYSPRCGFALETQYYPNAMMKSHFPSIVLSAGDMYESETQYHFKA